MCSTYTYLHCPSINLQKDFQIKSNVRYYYIMRSRVYTNLTLSLVKLVHKQQYLYEKLEKRRCSSSKNLHSVSLVQRFYYSFINFTFLILLKLSASTRNYRTDGLFFLKVASSIILLITYQWKPLQHLVSFLRVCRCLQSYIMFTYLVRSTF